MAELLQGTPELNPRQLTLLALVGSGHRLHEVAKDQHLSFYTVRNNLNDARERLSGRSLTHCVSICIGRGWLRVVDDQVYVVPVLGDT